MFLDNIQRYCEKASYRKTAKNVFSSAGVRKERQRRRKKLVNCDDGPRCRKGSDLNKESDSTKRNFGLETNVKLFNTNLKSSIL